MIRMLLLCIMPSRTVRGGDTNVLVRGRHALSLRKHCEKSAATVKRLRTSDVLFGIANTIILSVHFTREN